MGLAENINILKHLPTVTFWYKIDCLTRMGEHCLNGDSPRQDCDLLRGIDIDGTKLMSAMDLWLTFPLIN